MNCETARLLRETNDPELERHVMSCPSCLVGAHARYYEAPPGLEGRILQSLGRDESTPSHWRWLAVAAMLLLAVSAGWNIALLRSRVDTADNVLSAHVRSLAGTHLLDVPSTDQHTVRPWFAGKLDFAPPVKEVDGFPLLGGRLEYLQGHPAAALIYGRRNHVINVFVWPSVAQAGAEAETHKGYALDRWSDHGMTFWAVSDLNQAELQQFVTLFRGNQ